MTEQQRASKARVEAIVAADPVASKAKAKWEIARRALLVLTTACVLAALGLLVYLAGSANDGTEAIRDCTTPGGECFKRSQEQTGKAVAQIVEAQRQVAAEGSAPSRENLRLTQQNSANIQVILGILDREYPEAAAAVRAELSKEGK